LIYRCIEYLDDPLAARAHKVSISIVFVCVFFQAILTNMDSIRSQGLQVRANISFFERDNRNAIKSIYQVSCPCYRAETDLVARTIMSFFALDLVFLWDKVSRFTIRPMLGETKSSGSSIPAISQLFSSVFKTEFLPQETSSQGSIVLKHLAPWTYRPRIHGSRDIWSWNTSSQGHIVTEYLLQGTYCPEVPRSRGI
jgi:hypothetical protein